MRVLVTRALFRKNKDDMIMKEFNSGLLSLRQVSIGTISSKVQCSHFNHFLPFKQYRACMRVPNDSSTIYIIFETMRCCGYAYDYLTSTLSDLLFIHHAHTHTFIMQYCVSSLSNHQPSASKCWSYWTLYELAGSNYAVNLFWVASVWAQWQ